MDCCVGEVIRRVCVVVGGDVGIGNQIKKLLTWTE